MLAVLVALMLVSFSGCIRPDELDLPEVIPGEDSIVNDLTLTPDKYSARMSVFAALGKLDSAKTYLSESHGKTVATKGVITYTQNIECNSVKNGNEFYTKSVSDSTFVNVCHEAFAKNGKVAYRTDGGAILNSTKSEYVSVYGVTPDKLLSGHIYNSDTILFAQLESQENGLYTYKIVLDKTTATALLVRQMKMLGSLSSLPVFNDNIAVTLVMKEDFTPVSLSSVSKYTVAGTLLGTMDCTEENTVLFGNFNSSVSVPDTKDFNLAINEEPGKIDYSDEAIDENVAAVISAALNADLKGGIVLNGYVDYNGKKLPLCIKNKVDIDGIIDGTVDFNDAFEAEMSVVTYSGEMSVLYHEGKFYMNFMGNKYAFSTNEKDRDVNFEEIDINEFVTVTKNAENPSVYDITLSDEYMSAVTELLSAAGLLGEEDSLELGLSCYVSNGRIAQIDAAFKTDMTEELSARFYISDCIYEEANEEELSEYLTRMDFALDSTIKLLGFDASGKIALSYNTEEPDPAKAFELSAKYVINSREKNFSEVAAIFTKDIPEIVSALDDAETIEIAVKDGYTYLIAFDAEGNTVVAENLGAFSDKLADLFALIKGDDSEEEESTPSPMLKIALDILKKTYIISFESDATYENKLLKAHFGEEMTNLVRMMWNQLPRLIGLYVPGNQTVIDIFANEDFIQLMKFDKVFCDLSAGLRIPYDDDVNLVWKNTELYLSLTVFDVTRSEYDEEEDYDVIDVVYIGFTLTEEVPSEILSEATLAAIEAIAD